MKKLFLTAMVALTFVAAISAANSKQEKEAKKYAKKQAKEMAMQGWKTDGMYTLEEAFYKFRMELTSDSCNRELTGNVLGETTCRTLNQAKQWAMINAANEYAKESEMMLRSRIVGEIGASIEGASIDQFYEAYEALVQKEIKGDLKIKVGIYREKKDGSIEYRAFYIINEPRAASMRQRALMNAIDESNMLKEHAKELSDFVNEPVKSK